MIPFNLPYISGDELQYVDKAIQNKDLSGDGYFNFLSQFSLEKITGCNKVLLTSSCTHALEMCALLADIQPGDEVIMPSFTFVSSANAFVLRGAKVVFVDIRPDTMNIDEKLIEKAISRKTKAILVMHYAGVSCEMDTIMAIAQTYNLVVIEDAAQCIGAFYKKKHLGTIGHLGTLSFHSTKNIHCGEGGALLVNDERFTDRAEIIREKGTNRNAFIKGQVNKYSWVDIGSSYLMNELSAAFLYAQLLKTEEITKRRISHWDVYFKQFTETKMAIDLPFIPNNCRHNGHIFYIKCKDNSERNHLIDYLKSNGISSAFHYVPLHSAVAGKQFGRFSGKDKHTTNYSERLLRLPLYYDLESIEKIVSSFSKFHQFV
jgi:dTDP-4-amino-4,6-dideoxygalactose transaminase